MPGIPYSLASLTIRLATQEEIMKIRKGTFSQWARGMTLERYLNLESMLGTLESAIGGNFNVWVLAPREGKPNVFVASCETFRRESLILRPGDQTPSPIVSYGVATVFTPPEHRRNGYAAHMMRLLHRVLAPSSSLPPFPTDLWGQSPTVPQGVPLGDAVFSVLYSDVGPQFYKLCGPVPGAEGWEVRDPWSTMYEVSDIDLDEPTSKSLTWIEDQNMILDVMQADAWDYMTRAMTEKARGYGSGMTLVAVKPSHIQTTYLNARHTLSQPSPGFPWEIKGRWGARYWNNDLTTPSYVLWVPEPYPNSTLVITRMRIENARALSVLVSAARHFARINGLKRVEVWNTIESGWMDQVSEAWGGYKTRRGEHLSCFAWYGKEKRDDVIWDLNEKFVWC